MLTLLRPGDATRNPVLVDCLRAVAALLVLFAHADAHSLARMVALLPWRSLMGEVGVYLFFVLSGYLIWTSALRTLGRLGGLRYYAIHRVTRILPLYYANLAFILLVLPLVPMAFVPQVSAEVVWRHLTFTQALLPSVSRALNPVLWTLTHEALFYALVPALFLLRRHVLVVAAGAAVAHGVALQAPGFVLSPFLYHLPLFAVGILLAQTGRLPGPAAIPLLLLAAVLTSGNYRAMALALLIAALPMVFQGAKAWRWWPVRLFALVGVISYSLYIWHWLLLEMIGPNLGPVLPYANWIADYPFWRGFATILICLVVSALSYALIEAPGMGWLRRRLTPRAGRVPQPINVA